MVANLLVERGVSASPQFLDRMTIGAAIHRAYDEDSHFIFLIGKQEHHRGTVELILLHSSGNPERTSPPPPPPLLSLSLSLSLSRVPV